MNENTGVEDTPIVRFVDKILSDAIHANASEIHLREEDERMVVLFEIGGELNEIAIPPKTLATKILNRMRVMAQLGIYGAHNPSESTLRVKPENGDSVTFAVTNSPQLIVARRLDNNV